MKRLYARPTSHRFPWWAAILVACVLSAPATGVAAHPAGLVSPKVAVLTLSDVKHTFGSGFSSPGAHALPKSNVSIPGSIKNSNEYTKLAQDWVSGYAAEFTSLGSQPTVIDSSIIQYKTAGNAQKVAQDTFSNRVTLLKNAAATGIFKSSLKRYNGIGQYAELTTNDMRSAPGGNLPGGASLPGIPGAHQVDLYFTQGHFAGSIKIVSSAKISISKVAAAARLMDSRLRGG